MTSILSIKTLFRTPLKTLLTFLFLAATSYMCFLSIAEYNAVAREQDRTIGYYRGVGAIEAEKAPSQRYEYGHIFVPWFYNLVFPSSLYAYDGSLYADDRVANNPYGDSIDQFRYTGLSSDDIDAISNLPYVTSTSYRYMTAGVSDELQRADRGFITQGDRPFAAAVCNARAAVGQ